MQYYAIDEKGNKYEFEARKSGNSTFLTLPLAKFRNAKWLRALGDISSAQAGDDGYFISPANLRMNGETRTFFTERADASMVIALPIMAAYAIKKADRVCLVRIERNYNFSVEVNVSGGVYTINVLYDFAGEADVDYVLDKEGNHLECDDAYDDIRIEVVDLPLDADYNDIAAAEREIRLARGEIVTLKEKCKREAVEYARKYPVIRVRMGWKPSPSPVPHQTEENEPEMFVACTFARVRDFATELAKAGVEGAELQLVGWNIGGHDGRFPQLFPVDERLGGADEFKRTIDYVKSLGYRISTHTNNIDSYEIANTFIWDDCAIAKDGKPRQMGHYGGGDAYHVCPSRQLKNAKRDLPELAAYGENGVHFTDVVSIVPPDTCTNPDHPVRMKEGVATLQQMMEYTSNLFGAFSSEGCMDFAVKYLDFGLYRTFGDAFGKFENALIDDILPVWELAYHGTLLYNAQSKTINYAIKEKEDRLFAVMRGGKPTLYAYSKFRTGGETNWMGITDVRLGTDEEMQAAVAAVKSMLADYEPIKDKQLLFMSRYDKIGNGVEVATYSDGSKIVGNFTDQEKEYDGVVIPPYDYIVVC